MKGCSQTIDWRLLYKAQIHYEKFGFKYIEVPWQVSEKAIRSTLPEGNSLEVANKGNLVGSAEQSFVQMMLDGDIEPGRYMAVSPCFRNEVYLNDLWQSHFMKLELMIIHSEPHSEAMCRELVSNAVTFFNKHSLHEVHTEATIDGTDIMLGNIELGSYGYREYEGYSWSYGTGVAEPRFSYAMRQM